MQMGKPNPSEFKVYNLRFKFLAYLDTSYIKKYANGKTSKQTLIGNTVQDL